LNNNFFKFKTTKKIEKSQAYENCLKITNPTKYSTRHEGIDKQLKVNLKYLSNKIKYAMIHQDVGN
jgi:hypothetical protein